MTQLTYNLIVPLVIKAVSGTFFIHKQGGGVVANRRMFSKDVVETDKYLDMPATSQNLYFHLGMEADDDGFVTPRRIMRMIGATSDDLNVLISRGYLLAFEDGVVVIVDWPSNNYIQSDRYRPTIYQQHIQTLCIGENKRYVLSSEGVCIRDVSKPYPQVRLGKVREGKDRDRLTSKEDYIYNKDEKINLEISDEDMKAIDAVLDKEITS